MSHESPKYCIGDLYAGIVMNVKKPTIIMAPICRYYNEYKISTTILGPICGYCIFENGLMESKIGNDVGIAECSF